LCTQQTHNKKPTHTQQTQVDFMTQTRELKNANKLFLSFLHAQQTYHKRTQQTQLDFMTQTREFKNAYPAAVADFKRRFDEKERRLHGGSGSGNGGGGGGGGGGGSGGSGGGE
jgi:uncharacterized membrane protein YgcG